MGAIWDAKLTVAHVCEIPTYVYPGVTLSPIDLLAPIQESAKKARKAGIKVVMDKCILKEHRARFL